MHPRRHLPSHDCEDNVLSTKSPIWPGDAKAITKRFDIFNSLDGRYVIQLTRTKDCVSNWDRSTAYRDHMIELITMVVFRMDSAAAVAA